MTQALFSAEFDIWIYFSDVSLSFHLLSRWAWHLLGTRVEPAKWPATESWSKWRKGTRRTSTWSGKLDRRSEVLQFWILIFLILRNWAPEGRDWERKKRTYQNLQRALQISVVALFRKFWTVKNNSGITICKQSQLHDRLFPCMMPFLEH